MADTIDLGAMSPDPPKGTIRDVIKDTTDRFEQELADLSDLLYSAREHSLLLVFQGLDTSGKDGMVRKVLDSCNAQGVRVETFKAPTELERGHDFLWRVHAKTPALGEIVIFNRSHYEDVLVPRVHQLFSDEVIDSRYGMINDFERLLVTHKTIILKFFFHISKEEQKARLLEREQDVHKAWKLAVGDWKEREHWDQYTDAYQKALSRCAIADAPWHIVPANAKWYRNHVVLKAICDGLRPYKQQWLDSLASLGQKRAAELQAYRATLKH